MVQAVAVVAAYLFLFSALGSFGGWTAKQWTVVLGLVTTARGLWSIFFAGTLDVGQLVRTGKFDSYVLRPVSSLFLVSTAKISPDLWGETAVGVFMTFYGLHVSGVALTVGTLATALAAVVMGTAIYYALFLVVQATSFWIVDNTMILMLFERLDEYTRVPQPIFPGWTRAMFSSVIPLALIGYLPGSVIFGKADAWMLAVAAGVTSAVLVGAMWLWRCGLRRYSSAG